MVVGNLVGQGTSHEQAVVGDIPNLAAQLQALAEAGTIVAAGSTCMDLFKLRDLGCHEVKGFVKPTRVPYLGRKRLPEGASNPSVATATPALWRQPGLLR